VHIWSTSSVKSSSCIHRLLHNIKLNMMSVEENFPHALNRNAIINIASLAMDVYVPVSRSVLYCVIRVSCCAHLIRRANVTTMQDMLN